MFFTNPVISGCKAHAGGGVFLTRGRLLVTGGEISGNAANYEGGGMTLAAAYLSMTSTKLLRNTANFDGGGLSVTLSKAWPWKKCAMNRNARHVIDHIL